MNNDLEKRKKLKNDLLELRAMPLFNPEVKNTLFNAAGTIDALNRVEKEQEVLLEQMTKILKALIGQPIFWGSPGWKPETHIITDVRYEVYDSDFFDKKEVKYKGTKQVVIEVDEDGTYLAVNIGKNLFFNEKEAIENSQKS